MPRESNMNIELEEGIVVSLSPIKVKEIVSENIDLKIFGIKAGGITAKRKYKKRDGRRKKLTREHKLAIGRGVRKAKRPRKIGRPKKMSLNKSGDMRGKVGKVFTPSEEKIIINNYGKVPTAVIALKLGKTQKQIVDKATSLRNKGIKIKGRR